MYLFTEIEIKSENEISDITLVKKKKKKEIFWLKKASDKFWMKNQEVIQRITTDPKKSCKTWENDFSGIISRWNLMLMVKLMRN